MLQSGACINQLKGQGHALPVSLQQADTHTPIETSAADLQVWLYFLQCFIDSLQCSKWVWMSLGKHLPEQFPEAFLQYRVICERENDNRRMYDCMPPSGIAITHDFHLRADIQTSGLLAALCIAACKGRSLFQRMHTLIADCTKLHKNTSFAEISGQDDKFCPVSHARAKNKARNEPLLDNCALLLLPSTQQ